MVAKLVIFTLALFVMLISSSGSLRCYSCTDVSDACSFDEEAWAEVECKGSCVTEKITKGMIYEEYSKLR